MTKVVFLDAATLTAEMPQLSFEHEWINYAATREDETVARLTGASVAVTNKVKLGATELAALPELKLICVAATGYNIIDIEAARQHDVVVSNAPDYATDSIPEHVLMLILALKKNLLQYRAKVDAGEWSRSPIFCLNDFEISDVRGARFAIIGYGASGKATARLAEAFGAQVLIAERKTASEVRAGRVAFHKALREADILSLHCPLTTETRNLIAAPELNQMKRSAILINCARGGIVDEAALMESLRSNAIAGAGVDVLTQEPPTNGNILLSESLPNLIVTPHQAWMSHQSQTKLAATIVGNIEAFINGTPYNVVS